MYPKKRFAMLGAVLLLLSACFSLSACSCPRKMNRLFKMLSKSIMIVPISPG